ELVRLSGPSGPLAVAANGDLCVAVLPSTVPPPPKSVRIVRFARAQIERASHGGRRLAEGAAVAAPAGLPGAHAITFDDRDRLHWSDANHGGVARTRPGQLVADPVPLVPPGPLGTMSLGFVDSGGATFDAYQPETGATLAVLTSDWQTTCRVWTV